ncbi:MAG: ABC transporter permease, partial [Bacteroidales bacterium]|nr:ABC transporter permease [Bacteroidales bacterium]
MGEVTGFISKRLKLKGTLATVCTAVSFFVIIIAVAISSGFRQEIRNGLSLAGGDVRIIPTNHDYLSEGNPIPTDAPYFEKITELPIVESIYPVIYRAGIVKSGGQIHGVMVKGVEPSHPMCPAEGELNVRVPQSLCDALELDKESSVLTYFIGERVQVRKFKITEIYKDVLDNKEMCVVYAPIATLRRLNRWEDNQISAVEINLNITSEDAIKSATGDIGML